MSAYETCATVEAEGQVVVTGVPFAPGTEVDVVISRKPSDAPSAAPVWVWHGFETHQVATDLVRAAISIRRRFRVGYCNAAILTAAKGMDCHTVSSQDLNEGHNYHGVRDLNPCRSSAPAPPN